MKLKTTDDFILAEQDYFYDKGVKISFEKYDDYKTKIYLAKADKICVDCYRNNRMS